MTTNPREFIVKRKVLDHLSGIPGVFAYSTPVSRYGRSGIADITAVINGKAVYIECKRPSTYNNQTAAQKAFEGAVKAAGGYYFVVDSVDRLVSHLVDSELV